jgi:hypothetical protein
MAKQQRASEDQFNELHRQITEHYLGLIKSGEASIQELRAAAEWCIKNDINAPQMSGSPLEGLRAILPKIDPADIQARVYK